MVRATVSILIRLLPFFMFIVSTMVYAGQNFYSIVLCQSHDQKTAIECKQRCEKNNDFNITLYTDKFGNHKTILGRFETLNEAKYYRFNVLQNIDRSSDLSIESFPVPVQILPPITQPLVQTSVPTVKILTQQKLTSEITENKIIAKDINSTITKPLLVSANIIDKVTVDKKKNNDLNTTLNFNEINSSNTLVSKSKTCIQSPFIGLLNPKQFEQIILEINSTTHQLQVYGVNKSNHNLLKTYIVSTARKNTKMPMGKGSISAISINPIWYPTEQTIEHFRDKKGIDLPTSVLPGDPLNYMGLAKINLTHIVDGKNTYRIHGTINEKTIGTNESSGCIRMKNKEVLELAYFLKIFTQLKSFHNVHVFIM